MGIILATKVDTVKLNKLNWDQNQKNRTMIKVEIF